MQCPKNTIDENRPIIFERLFTIDSTDQKFGEVDHFIDQSPIIKRDINQPKKNGVRIALQRVLCTYFVTRRLAAKSWAWFSFDGSGNANSWPDV